MTTNIQNLATTTDLTAHDVALAAFHDDLADDYRSLEGEDGFWLIHPTDDDLGLAFDLEFDEDGNIVGWTYTTHNRDSDIFGDHWFDLSTDGHGLDEGETIADLLDHIAHTLTEWAKN